MKNYFIFIWLLLFCNGCKEYLDVKPDKKLVVITNTNEAQSLLNNVNVFNGAYPVVGEIASDHFYLVTADWLSTNTIVERNAYIWHEDIFNENPRNEWSLSYQKVYFANQILDGLAEGRIKGTSSEDLNVIKGQALFFRAYSFFNLLQIFSPAWDEKSSSTDLGIALRLTSDFNEPTVRSTVEECYSRLIDDTIAASELLPLEVPVKTRPSKSAAFAFLARVFLTRGEYSRALEYSEKALMRSPALIDYSSRNSSASFPFQLFNEEVVFHSYMNTPAIFFSPKLKVDSSLRNSYREGDLRPKLFFSQNVDGTFSFKGSYSGSNSLFNGFSVNELYLIKAECLARLNQGKEALNVLNELLTKRWEKGRYSPLNLESKDSLLHIILKEREKELLFRGLRWIDLRRLNKEAGFAVTLSRYVNNNLYELKPDDVRYVFKIPENVIAVTGIEQNP
jgi:tetratricopeptide (TPR) repeat protein